MSQYISRVFGLSWILVPCLALALQEQPDEPLEAAPEVRMPVKVVAGRLIVRCEVSTKFRRTSGNFFVDFERACGLELHNRTAHWVRVDAEGGVPISLRLPGAAITVDGREHGDEEYMEAFTRLYSKELGETAVVGTIGSKVFAHYHAVFDLHAGFIYLRPPAEHQDGPPEQIEGSIVTSATLDNDLVWFPVRLGQDRLMAMSLGTSRYDTVIDESICEELDRPAGDVGAVTVKTVDLAGYVAFRPEEFIQVHSDGALGMAGLNILEHFRVEVDRVNRHVRFTETVPADFPQDDLAFFQARAEEEPESLVAFLDEHPEARLAREAAELLLNFQLDGGAEASEFELALTWMDRTRIEDLRTTETLTTMKSLIEARRPDVAVLAGEIGVKSGRKDRYPESIHKVHLKLGELLLDAGNGEKGWEHLLSAAFGIPDDGNVNLLLGRFYEGEKRYRRAMSRYIQAVITPETGPQAVAGLERIQALVGGEPLSVDLVDKLVAGKVHNFAAATKFEETDETRTNRVVLAELFTNPHFGRKLQEGWRSFAIGGAMAAEGLLSHFPRERLVVLSYHIDIPEPNALINPLAMHTASLYGIDGPYYFKINGVQTGPGAERWRKAEQVYNQNRSLVLDELQRASTHTLDAKAKLENGVVSGNVTVQGPANPDLTLQIVLAERGVLYPGKAKIVVHRMVVRTALTGDLNGIALAPTAGVSKHEFSRSLAEITGENEKFLAEYERNGGASASRLSTRIDPRQISVVAFLRNRYSQEVVQAIQVDLGTPEGEGIR